MATPQRDTNEDTDRIAGRIRSSLDPVVHEYAGALARAGHDLEDVGGAEAVAEAVATVLPRPNRFVARIGPVYTTGQLQRLLPGMSARPITDEAVRDRRRNGRLIGVKTREGRWAYPAYQFRVASGKLIPREDVLDLWGLLPHQSRDVDALTLVAWLTGPRSDLGGQSPLERLDTDGLDDRLQRAAGRVRRRLAA